ncbi:hypothetical protein, partial [Aeromicrobium alkaliterrae]|uniref:hypothetical protein n=1 Tax=Aeromicrobium alkaliterrae TaxID=302168 RepID=UPI0031CF0215
IVAGMDTSKLLESFDASRIVAGMDTSKLLESFDTSRMFDQMAEQIVWNVTATDDFLADQLDFSEVDDALVAEFEELARDAVAASLDDEDVVVGGRLPALIMATYLSLLSLEQRLLHPEIAAHLDAVTSSVALGVFVYFFLIRKPQDK